VFAAFAVGAAKPVGPIRSRSALDAEHREFELIDATARGHRAGRASAGWRSKEAVARRNRG
jgi:hypothetical protein